MSVRFTTLADAQVKNLWVHLCLCAIPRSGQQCDYERAKAAMLRWRDDEVSIGQAVPSYERCIAVCADYVGV